MNISRTSPLDKLLTLWTVCLIANRREQGLSCSYAAIRNDFDEETAFLVQTYCWVANAKKLLDTTNMQLTKRGLATYQRWERISEEIYSVS